MKNVEHRKDLLKHLIQDKAIWLYTHIKVWCHMLEKVGTVIENEKWKIKVFALLKNMAQLMFMS